jgi:DNA repair exonuclease SbcCD ATPase subunit
MTKDLDDRIADLEAKRRDNSLATARDAERVVEELNEAVRQASVSVGGLNARTDLIDERASTLEGRIRQLWVFVGAGVTAAVIVAVVVVAFAFWTGARVKAAAENEATLLRDRYAAEIVAAREQGEAALADLQSDFVRQSEDAAEQLTEIGADLAAMSEERDVVQQELEHFIMLRDRVGIQLVDFRGRTVVVVPEGARLRRWRAAGLSEVAHLNGRMYRLSD